MASSAPMYHFFVVCLWHGLAGSGDAPMVRVKCFIANASCSSWDSAIIRYNIRRLLDAIWLLISLYNARLCIALLPPPPCLPSLFVYVYRAVQLPRSPFFVHYKCIGVEPSFWCRKKNNPTSITFAGLFHGAVADILSVEDTRLNKRWIRGGPTTIP
jgi:hypothetical protein